MRHARASPLPAMARCGRLRCASSATGKQIAVVLSGCGVYDGSEVHESVFVLSQVSARGGTYQCFAPDKAMMHVVDHTAGSEMPETRNVLTESARIARGAVKALTELDPAGFDAVIFPGGFGAAKNLSDFATAGPELAVETETARVITGFRAADKPLGFCCISPVLAAKVLGGGVELTVGSDEESEEWPYAGAAGAIDAVGATHVVKPLAEAHTDAAQKVVSSPAYMNNTRPIHEVEASVRAMVDGVVELL